MTMDAGKLPDLRLTALPKPTQFRAWRNHTRQALISCKPLACEEVLRWIQKVEDAHVTLESLADSGKFIKLDIARATEIARIAT